MKTKEINAIQDMDRVKRLNLINSITGISPANLIGTISNDSIENLSIFSSVIHIGSNPPLIGFILRPTKKIEEILMKILLKQINLQLIILIQI